MTHSEESHLRQLRECAVEAAKSLRQTNHALADRLLYLAGYATGVAEKYSHLMKRAQEITQGEQRGVRSGLRL